MELLQTDYLEVWTSARTVPQIRFASRVRAISSTGLDLLGVTEPPRHLIEELRSFDSIVSWYGTNRAEFQETVAALNLPITFFPALPSEGCGMHATDFYLDQVRTLVGGLASGSACPTIPCPQGPREFAVIHPFSGSPRKNWPFEKFRALAAKIEQRMPVQWLSGDEDPPLPGAVRIADLYDLACWLATARVYVGNDSGVTHLAAAVKTPVLALFGHTNPLVWAPRGPHVRVLKVMMDSRGSVGR